MSSVTRVVVFMVIRNVHHERHVGDITAGRGQIRLTHGDEIWRQSADDARARLRQNDGHAQRHVEEKDEPADVVTVARGEKFGEDKDRIGQQAEEQENHPGGNEVGFGRVAETLIVAEEAAMRDGQNVEDEGQRKDEQNEQDDDRLGDDAVAGTCGGRRHFDWRTMQKEVRFM